MPTNPPSPVAPVGTRELDECAAELESWRAECALSAEQLRSLGDMPDEAASQQRIADAFALALRCVRAVQALDAKGGDWVLRESEHGRGWRLHQTTREDSHPDVLTAIERAASPASREGGDNA